MKNESRIFHANGKYENEARILRRHNIEWHKKFSLSFSCIIFFSNWSSIGSYHPKKEVLVCLSLHLCSLSSITSWTTSVIRWGKRRLGSMARNLVECGIALPARILPGPTRQTEIQLFLMLMPMSSYTKGSLVFMRKSEIYHAKKSR